MQGEKGMCGYNADYYAELCGVISLKKSQWGDAARREVFIVYGSWKSLGRYRKGSESEETEKLSVMLRRVWRRPGEERSSLVTWELEMQRRRPLRRRLIWKSAEMI